jgi:hypothetical protein
MEKKKKLRVLSLGAGVQSTTVALMIEKGEIPKVDCAIFADVKAEPQEVYKHLDWLKTELSYPLYVEKERLEIIGNMPCYACYQDGKEVNAEVHHIRKHTGMGSKTLAF